MKITDYSDNIIGMMKHAIGLDYNSPKRGKYEPHRNHYSAGQADQAAWQQVEADGYAMRTSETMYHLTPKALDEMEELIGAKICDWENVGRWGAICGNCRYHYGKFRGKGKTLCHNLHSRYHACGTKPTTRCVSHRFKDGLAYGGLK
jgi:hypothetical protein